MSRPLSVLVAPDHVSDIPTANPDLWVLLDLALGGE